MKEEKKRWEGGAQDLGPVVWLCFVFRGRYQTQPQEGPESIGRHCDQRHRVHLKKENRPFFQVEREGLIKSHCSVGDMMLHTVVKEEITQRQPVKSIRPVSYSPFHCYIASVLPIVCFHPQT